jgi:hypothetical protein
MPAAALPAAAASWASEDADQLLYGQPSPQHHSLFQMSDSMQLSYGCQVDNSAVMRPQVLEHTST